MTLETRPDRGGALWWVIVICVGVPAWTIIGVVDAYRWLRNKWDNFKAWFTYYSGW